MENNSLLVKGYRLGEDGKYQEAEKVFTKVLLIDPELFHVWYEFGTVLDLQGKTKDAEIANRKAEAGFLKIIEEEPDSSDAILGLALVLRTMGREDEAMKLFGKSITEFGG